MKPIQSDRSFKDRFISGDKFQMFEELGDPTIVQLCTFDGSGKKNQQFFIPRWILEEMAGLYIRDEAIKKLKATKGRDYLYERC